MIWEMIDRLLTWLGTFVAPPPVTFDDDPLLSEDG